MRAGLYVFAEMAVTFGASSASALILQMHVCRTLRTGKTMDEMVNRSISMPKASHVLQQRERVLWNLNTIGLCLMLVFLLINALIHVWFIYL